MQRCAQRFAPPSLLFSSLSSSAPSDLRVYATRGCALRCPVSLHEPRNRHSSPLVPCDSAAMTQLQSRRVRQPPPLLLDSLCCCIPSRQARLLLSTRRWRSAEPVRSAASNDKNLETGAHTRSGVSAIHALRISAAAAVMDRRTGTQQQRTRTIERTSSEDSPRGQIEPVAIELQGAGRMDSEACHSRHAQLILRRTVKERLLQTSRRRLNSHSPRMHAIGGGVALRAAVELTCRESGAATESRKLEAFDTQQLSDMDRIAAHRPSDAWRCRRPSGVCDRDQGLSAERGARRRSSHPLDLFAVFRTFALPHPLDTPSHRSHSCVPAAELSPSRSPWLICGVWRITGANWRSSRGQWGNASRHE